LAAKSVGGNAIAAGPANRVGGTASAPTPAPTKRHDYSQLFAAKAAPTKRNDYSQLYRNGHYAATSFSSPPR
jgi:hypothetical protein